MLNYSNYNMDAINLITMAVKKQNNHKQHNVGKRKE